MATIKQIKTQIENANALGIANLTEKGVTIPETATTYDIMKSIADVSGGGGTDEIENLIDESGVLDSTEGTVTEKVEELIMKANSIKAYEWRTKNARMMFHNAKQFPTKAVINLPYAYDVYQAFAYWNEEPIPIVEELTVIAPSITTNDYQRCMGQMFVYNNGVKKVILNMPDESQYMENTFSNTLNLEEVVLNFSTKNIQKYYATFNGSTVKRIIGVLDFSSATNVGNMFYFCEKLEEVTFEPNTLSLSISLGQSSLLTNESVQSIIDGLKTLEEGATAKTLTLNKAIVLTDEQKATINAKGWTLVQ